MTTPNMSVANFAGWVPGPINLLTSATGSGGVFDVINLVTARGDLVAGTGTKTVAIVPVGTDGQVLTADSTNRETGLSWRPITINVTPATYVTDGTSYGTISVTGTSPRYAREDHYHGTPSLGTTGTTAAAGNDSRITGALQTGATAGGDLGGTLPNPSVVATHLTSPLPLTQGGTAAATAGGARTSLGLGTAATTNVDTNSNNIQPLGTQAAGSTGMVTDSGHVHQMPRLDQIQAPTASVGLNSQKITGLAAGVAPTDAVNVGQLPISTGPTGPASGDLSGTYPSPTVTATHLATPLPVAQGGTASADTATARTTLGVPPSTRQIISGTGLSGGGDLSADRTLTVSYGTTSGTAAQGNDSRITGALQAASNLSDVASASTARTNLAVPPASRQIISGTGLTGGGDLTADRTLTVSYGTTAGTAAQGNDSRITGALQIVNNLSDLASAATARTNLAVLPLAGGTLTGPLHINTTSNTGTVGRTSYRLYPSTNGPSASYVSGSTQILGLSFKVTSAATLDGFWWWVADSNQNPAAMDFALWTSTGSGTGTYVTGSKVTSGTLSLGWNYVPYTTSISLTAGTEYRAVCRVQPGSYAGSFSFTSLYWYSGPGAGGIVNGPLTAFSEGGTGNAQPSGDGQMAYANGGDVTANYPHVEYQAANYWLDVQVSTAGLPLGFNDAKDTGLDLLGSFSGGPGVPGTDSDSTARINAWVYQQNQGASAGQQGQYGEFVRAYTMKSWAHPTIAFYGPTSGFTATVNGPPVSGGDAQGNWQPLAWLGCQFTDILANGATTFKHFAIEVPDKTNGYMIGRLIFPYGDTTTALTDVGLDTTNIHTNAANLVISGSKRLGIAGAAGTQRSVEFSSETVPAVFSGTKTRFKVTCSDTAESGANAGSDLWIEAFSDTGVSLGKWVQLTRATGAMIFPSTSPSVFGANAATTTAGRIEVQGSGQNMVYVQPTANLGNGLAGFAAQMNQAADFAFGCKLAADTAFRGGIGSDGKHFWGDGTLNPPDCTISRAGATSLQTNSAFAVTGNLTPKAALAHQGTTLGFYNTGATTKQTVTGSRGGNAALQSLLTALSTIGLLTDSSTA